MWWWFHRVSLKCVTFCSLFLGSSEISELIHSDPIFSILQLCAPSRCADIHLKSNALSKLLVFILCLVTIGKPFVPRVFPPWHDFLCKQLHTFTSRCANNESISWWRSPGIHGKLGMIWECLGLGPVVFTMCEYQEGQGHEGHHPSNRGWFLPGIPWLTWSSGDRFPAFRCL